MLETLRTPAFLRYWVGQLTSFAGNTLLFVALPFYVYDLTGSALATGAMFMAQTLPRMAFASFAGVFADRYNRRQVRLAADAARAVVLLPLLVVHSADLVWIVYVVAFAEAAFTQFSAPATLALIPRLVDERRVLPALSLYQLTNRMANVLGPALGGAVLVAGGLGTVVLVDAGTYVLSGVMVATLPRTAGVPEPGTRGGGAWREWIAGLAHVRGDVVLAGVFAGAFALGVGDGLLNSALVIFVRDALGGSSFVFGALVTAVGLGSVTGGVVIAARGTGRERALLMLGPLGLSLLVSLMSISVSVPWAIAVVFLIGFPSMAWNVSAQTVLVSAVPDGLRGRVSGAFETLIAVAMMLGLAAGALSIDALGPRTALQACAACDLLAAFMVVAVLRRRASPAPTDLEVTAAATKPESASGG